MCRHCIIVTYVLMFGICVVCTQSVQVDDPLTFTGAVSAPIIHNKGLQINVGQHLTDGVFDDMENVGLQMCAKICFLRNKCKVIGYNMLSRLCEFGEKLASTGTDDVSAVVSYRSEWNDVGDMTGKCANHNCPDGSTCFAPVNVNGRICIITECDDPPYRPNIVSPVFNSSKRTVGSTVSYGDCISGTNMHGQQTMTCLANGQWSPTTYGCCDCSNEHTVIGDCECLIQRSPKKNLQEAKSLCQSHGEQLAVIRSAEHLQRLSRLDFSGVLRIDGQYQNGIWKSTDSAIMEWVQKVPERLKSLSGSTDTDTMAIEKYNGEIKLLSIGHDAKEEVVCQIL